MAPSLLPAPSSPTPPGAGSRHHLLNTAVLVTVLGVLPFVWDAPVVWQVLGPMVCVAVAGHSLRQLWRGVFSTAPRPRHPSL